MRIALGIFVCFDFHRLISIVPLLLLLLFFFLHFIRICEFIQFIRQRHPFCLPLKYALNSHKYHSKSLAYKHVHFGFRWHCEICLSLSLSIAHQALNSQLFIRSMLRQCVKHIVIKYIIFNSCSNVV